MIFTRRFGALRARQSFPTLTPKDVERRETELTTAQADPRATVLAQDKGHDGHRKHAA